MGALKKFDAGLARGEGAIAAVVLISMIVVASIQALLRNLTYLELEWANTALSTFDWADQFLKKGTLWLAFLGASLATRDERHIAIDVLPKLLSDRGRHVVRGIVGIAAGIISFLLARAFWGAVLVNALERPVSYEVFGDDGPLHVCDATLAQIEAARLTSPTLFCGVRSTLAAIGAPVETPAAALQLVVPAAFALMAIRLIANGIHAFLDLGKPVTEHDKHEDQGWAERIAAEVEADNEASEAAREAEKAAHEAEESGAASAARGDGDGDGGGDGDEDDEASASEKDEG